MGSLVLRLQTIGLPDGKSRFTGEDPDAREDGGQGGKGEQRMMVGWHHRLNGHGFEQTPGESGGQGSLACCHPWCHKESYTT